MRARLALLFLILALSDDQVRGKATKSRDMTYSQSYDIHILEEGYEGRRHIPLVLAPGEEIGTMVSEACQRYTLPDDWCATITQLVHEQYAEKQSSTRGVISTLSFSDAVAALFGMRESFDNFGQVAEAALRPESFEDVTSWNRFQVPLPGV